jgi:hypothetical protein
MAESMNVSRKRTSQMHCFSFFLFFFSLFPVVLASASFSFSPFVLFHRIGKARFFFSCVFYLNCKGKERAFFCAFTYLPGSTAIGLGDV